MAEIGQVGVLADFLTRTSRNMLYCVPLLTTTQNQNNIGEISTKGVRNTTFRFHQIVILCILNICLKAFEG